MIAYILGSFAVLTLLTAGYNQIPPNTWTWTGNDSFVDGKINLDNTRIKLKVKAVIIPVETPKLTPSEIEALIRKLAKEENFKWSDYLVKIAKCESQLDATKSNKKGNNPKNSIDRGLMMINSYWHSEITDEQAYNPVFATKWAMKLINSGHQSEFVCDKIIKAKKKL